MGRQLASLQGLSEAMGEMVQSITARRQSQPEKALAHLDRALAHTPLFLPAYMAKAELLQSQHRYDLALAALNRYLQYVPDEPQARERRQSLIREGEAYWGAQIGAHGEVGAAWLSRGRFRLELGDYEGAQADLERSLALSPDQGEAWLALGQVLEARGGLQAALEALAQAARRNPDQALAYLHQSRVLRALRRHPEAQAAGERGTALAPDMAAGWAELALACLSRGDFPRGWELWEWRWKTDQLRGYQFSSQPLWLGGSPLKGKVLLLWAEQGLGDSLQFCRYGAALAPFAEQIYLAVPSGLVSLLAAQGWGLQVLDMDGALPDHDYQCPLMSLPLTWYLLTGEARPLAFPSPYLRAPMDLGARTFPSSSQSQSQSQSQSPSGLAVEVWSAALPRIGLVWAGRQVGLANPFRDMPLSALAPLLDFPAQWFSLQPSLPEADQNSLLLARFCNGRPHFADFSQTAALVDSLDLVIAADTAVAHLAGALGKPCWLLLRSSGEWRWEVAADHSPWYPSLRLFRQSQLGQWGPVVAQVLTALKERYPAGAPQDRGAQSSRISPST
ncbi:tetratricopeptide repeat protein [Azospira inquinata]|uniref:Glycosyltransferase family protein n=1 Tax=Azospira inquinata TaxID=2785627 RepID=A0A975SLR9_9RHOO|nr:tetratricopeptide repeat protein [Azospira inquinata]QWT46063.1 glycosyltransferase family protein [Azospira inquinata]QWT48608.1 glycosyltransferase family protein [Azospira inquinata]